jgi:hypothetical protein
MKNICFICVKTVFFFFSSRKRRLQLCMFAKLVYLVLRRVFGLDDGTVDRNYWGGGGREKETGEQYN